MLEDENIEGYMATIHVQSPGYAQTEQIIQQMFNMYDLEYELADIKVIEKYDNEAKVNFIQITKKIRGPEFKNNKIAGIHILKKSNGKWKIYYTEINNVDYLD